MPFTIQEFLDVFAGYNETVFPAQIALLIIALIAIRLAANGDRTSSKTVAAILGFFWLWMGVMYHWAFFSEINTLAFVFGGFFVLEGGLLFYSGAVRNDLSLHDQPGARHSIGTIFIVYALLIYPIIGLWAGHSYPYSPTFGVPCPTTIFMFGVLVRSGRTVPLYLLPIPMAWSLLGFSAAFSLGIWEDVGLLVAGPGGGLLLISYHIRQRYEIGPGLSLKEN